MPYKQLIEQLVHLHGDIKFHELPIQQRLNLISYALKDNRCDNYEVFLEQMDMPNLISLMLSGIYEDEHMADEIKDRLMDAFESTIDEDLSQQYVLQYIENTPEAYSIYDCARI